jgi:tetratricopeptide (TPR) repeat protein
MTSMATLFSLWSLLCYARARLAAGSHTKAVLFAASILTGIMALFSKENSGMLPVMLLGYEFFFLRQAHSIKRRKLLILVILSALVFILICALFLGSNPVDRILAGYGTREFTLGQRLLTQTRIIFHYLSLLVLPLPSRLNLAYDFQLSTGLLAPGQTLLALVGLAGLIFLGFSLYRRARLASFAIFWFLGNLFIESSVIPLELIFEHRMYMPSMFLILTAVAWSYRLGARHVNRVRIPLVAIVILFSLFTWQRNTIWKSEVSIWTDVLNKAPNLARAYGNLGKAYGRDGKHKEAEELFRQAIRIDPLDGLSYISLGAALENQNHTSEALTLYYKALTDKTLTLKHANRAQLHRNLARLQLKLNNPKASIGHANQARQLNPLDYEVYTLLSAAYFKNNNYPEAEETLRTGIGLFPEKGELYIQLGVIYENQNRLQEAVTVLQKALNSKKTDLARAYNTLGIVYWRMGEFQKSVTAARRAIAANPDLLDAYLTLGITYEEMGQQEMALEQFRTAWQKGLDMVALYNEWALNFINMNMVDKAILYLQEAVKLDPDRLESFINLETAYRKKGMLKEAEITKRKAESLRLHKTVQ